MNKFMRPLMLASSLCVSVVSLSGCEAVVAGSAAVAAHQAFTDEGQNIAAQNYAVADFLIQQADTYIKPQSLIIAEPLTDIESPETSTTLARLIPEQIGVRISQLGYRVDLGQVTTTNDTNYLRPKLRDGEKPDFILTGNYRRGRSEVDVKMRMIDLNRNRIVAVFDYIIENDSEIRRLSEPKPKIIRMEKSN